MFRGMTYSTEHNDFLNLVMPDIDAKMCLAYFLLHKKSVDGTKVGMKV